MTDKRVHPESGGGNNYNYSLLLFLFFLTQKKLRTIYFKDGKRRPNSF